MKYYRFALAWIAAAPAFGQYATASYSRPSAQGPSVNVGGVGGKVTRFTPTIQSLGTRSSLTSLSAGLERFGLERDRLPAPAVQLPGAYSLSAPGVAQDLRAPDYYAQLARGGTSVGELMQISNLDMYFSDSTPVLDPLGPEILVFGLPPLPPDDRSAYGRFFDLTPARAEPVGGTSLRTLVEIEEQESLGRRAPLRVAALQTFKEGTAAEDVEGVARDRLAHAVILLRNVLRLDPDDPLLHLLLVQSEMERRYHQVAFTSLLQAVDRHPDLFAVRTELTTYYGDPRRFAATARDGLRMGMEATDISGFALAGYSAWAVGDAARLRQAIEGLEKAARLTEANARGHVLVGSLRAGLETIQ